MVRKIKRQVKILKEIGRNVKEIKKEKNSNEEDGEESELERDVETGGGGFSPATRTAPVLQADSSNLEQTAARAPAAARNTTNDASTAATGGGSLYSANYAARYDNQNYETREQEQIVRPTVRAAGSLNADFDLRNLRQLPTAVQTSSQPGQENWVGGVPEERRYQPKDDALKEQTKQIDKRRRMF